MTTGTEECEAWITREVVVTSQFGIHSRTAAQICIRAIRFAAEIIVEKPETIVIDGRVAATNENNWQSADAKSIMSLLMLAATVGTRLRIRARGSDAQAAIDALEQWFAGVQE